MSNSIHTALVDVIRNRTTSSNLAVNVSQRCRETEDNIRALQAEIEESRRTAIATLNQLKSIAALLEEDTQDLASTQQITTEAVKLAHAETEKERKQVDSAFSVVLTESKRVNDVFDVRASLVNLSTALDVAKRTYDGQLFRLREVKVELHALQTTAHESEQELAKLKDSVAACEREMVTLSSKLDATKAAAAEAALERDEHEKALHKSQEDLAALQARLQAEIEAEANTKHARQRHLAALEFAADTDAVALAPALAALRMQLEEATAAAEASRAAAAAELEVNEKALASVTALVALRKSDLENLRKAHEEAQAQVQTLTAQHTRLSDLATQLHQAEEAQREASKCLVEARAEVKAALVRVLSIAATRRGELDKLREEFATLQLARDETVQQIINAREAYAQRWLTLDVDIAALKEQVASKLDQKNRFEAAAASAQEEAATELARLRATINDMQVQHSALVSQRELLQKSVDTATQSRAELQEQLRTYTQLVDAGEMRSEEEIGNAHKEMKSQITQEKAEWKKRVADLRAVSTTLGRDLKKRDVAHNRELLESIAKRAQDAIATATSCAEA